MSDLPAPLTPPDCDLRDFSRLMVDIPRLLSSTFNAKASKSPVAWMIGHKLWYRSWHQVPAASLPDDDDELCYLAELGFDLKTFRKAKGLAMHGWVKCSDGRLYHPVVAEAALDAWQSKLRRRHNTECARVKKHNQRHNTDHVLPTFEEFVAGDCQPVTLPAPRDRRSKSSHCPEGHDDLSSGTSSIVPREIGSKGKGEGKGDSSNRPSVSSISDADRPEPVFLPTVLEQPDAAQIAFERHDALRREFVPNARTVDFTPERRRHLVSRLKEIEGLAGWDEVLSQIRGSPFLRGETSRNGFVAVIDWLLKPANLRKVREGNYDHDEHAQHPGRSNGRSLPRSPIDGILAAHGGRTAG
nr:DUF1376 domain-containing protein [Novosphingobium panipatense]